MQKPKECPFCHSLRIGLKQSFPDRVRWRCYECKKSWSVPNTETSKFLDNKESVVTSDKKVGQFDWREWAPHLMERQQLHEKASCSQDKAELHLKTSYRYIVWKHMADTHLGAIGSDYGYFQDVSDQVLSIPYLYISLGGDPEDDFISFKNQLPIVQQILSPAEQDEFLESWLDEIYPKLLFANWGNHGEFEERVSGRNTAKRILAKRTVYFNGIGVCLLYINDICYKIVVTHKTRYNSSFNKTHGLKQLARREIPDADVYLAEHTHDPAYEVSFERGMFQVYAVTGSIKVNDGYAKRYFSYFSTEQDVAFVLDSEKHRIIPFPCLGDALDFAKTGNTLENT